MDYSDFFGAHVYSVFRLVSAWGGRVGGSSVPWKVFKVLRNTRGTAWVVCPPESLLTASSGGEWAGSVPLFWNGVMCRRADIESCCSQLASRTQIGSPQAEYWSPLAHRHRQHPSHWNHLPIGRKPRIWQIDCEKRFQKCLTVEKKGNFWPQCFFFLLRPCVHGHLHYFWNEARPFTFRIYIYIYIHLSTVFYFGLFIWIVLWIFEWIYTWIFTFYMDLYQCNTWIYPFNTVLFWMDMNDI